MATLRGSTSSRLLACKKDRSASWEAEQAKYACCAVCRAIELTAAACSVGLWTGCVAIDRCGRRVCGPNKWYVILVELYMYVYACTYVHIYIYVYVCNIHTYIHTYILIYIYTHIYMYIYIYIHTHIYIYINMYAYMYTSLYIHIYIYVCVCVLVRAHFFFLSRCLYISILLQLIFIAFSELDRCSNQAKPSHFWRAEDPG